MTFEAGITTGTSVVYTWDFGDGTVYNVTVMNVTHTYRTAGHYTVRLLADNILSNETYEVSHLHSFFVQLASTQ